MFPRYPRLIMQNPFRPSLRYAVGAVALGAVLFAAGTFAQITAPPAPDRIGGFAYASNIGYIQFSGNALDGTEYKAGYDPVTGLISGYAWSQIGWIHFDPSGPFPSVPGSSAFSARLDSGKIKGWARACAVFESGCNGALLPIEIRGGWDGWIALEGRASDPANTWYGVDASTSTLSGWAWDSDVSGWINFNGTLFTNSTGCVGTGCGGGGSSTTPCVGAECGGGGTPMPPGTGAGGALTVTLVANPRSGRVPLNVQLTATVGGDSQATAFHYRFDCDGYEIQNLNISNNVHTATCSYSRAANYTARVYVEDAAGKATSATNVTSVRVLPRGPRETNPR